MGRNGSTGGGSIIILIRQNPDTVFKCIRSRLNYDASPRVAGVADKPGGVGRSCRSRSWFQYKWSGLQYVLAMWDLGTVRYLTIPMIICLVCLGAIVFDLSLLEYAFRIIISESEWIQSTVQVPGNTQKLMDRMLLILDRIIGVQWWLT